tara:strand:- start:122 stop:376 length:255 start_codon:yes stop_codon:yes gene_type:complete
MAYNNFTYATISIDDLNKVDFDQTGETSAQTIRKSLDSTKFLLKWIDLPTFIEDETIVPIQTYTHKEILAELAGEEWTDSDSVL